MFQKFEWFQGFNKLDSQLFKHIQHLKPIKLYVYSHFENKLFAFTFTSLFKRDVAQPGSAHVWGAWGRKFESCHPDNQKLRIAEFLRLKGLKFKRFKVDELKRARLDVFGHPIFKINVIHLVIPTSKKNRARLDVFVHTDLNGEAMEIFRPLYLKIFIFSS